MLVNVETIFDEQKALMKHLKKKSYENNMKLFEEQYGHYFQEMTEYVENKEDKDVAAKEVAVCFVTAVKDRFATGSKKKISASIQTDLNFFMIYYVFPAILRTEHKYGKLIADTLCSEWGSTFKNSKIGYTDYDSLYVAFREKIFGIF